MKRIKKISFDFHGVLDEYSFIREFAKACFDSGIEVHIVTGASLEDYEKESAEFNINKTHFFSIQDYLNRNHFDKNIRKNGFDRYNYPDELWNAVKGAYCMQQDIDLHFEDSLEYKEYFLFREIFVLVDKNDIQQMQYVKKLTETIKNNFDTNQKIV